MQRSFVPYSILKVLKLAMRSNRIAAVLYPTTFSRFSSFMHNQFDKLYVLYSTTFSRFSSAVIDTVYAKWFCTIQHYQCSQTDGVYRSGMHVLYPTKFSRFSSSENIQQCCQQFCTLQHPQGSQTDKRYTSLNRCFVPYSILKVLKPPRKP